MRAGSSAVSGGRPVAADMVPHHRSVEPGRPIDSPTATRAITQSLGRVDTSFVKPVRGAVLESIKRVCPAFGRG